MAEMKKELKFSAKLDTQEFDKTVDALQRKLKDIYKGSEQGKMSYETQERLAKAGLGSKPTAGDRQKADQADAKARRDTDNFIRTQIREQENLGKKIAKQVEDMKKLREEQEKLVRLGRDESQVKEKILNTEKSLAANRGQMAAKEESIRSALDQREMFGTGGMGRLRQAYRGGGMGGLMTAGGRMGGQFLRGIGTTNAVLGAMGAAGSALGVGSQLVTDFGMAPSLISQQRGQAAGVYNQNLENIFQGRGYEDQFYAPETKKAMQDAKKAVDAKRTSDTINIFRDILIGAGAGAAGGSIFAGVGAIPGAIGGGIAGAAKNYRTILGKMGIGPYSQQLQSGYDVFESQQFAQNKEAQKALNPIKKLAFEDFQKNMGANLSLQRAVGLSDQDMFGFYGDITKQGFTRGMGRDTAQAILAAGGTTMGAREGAGTALRAERNLNLTNSAQVLGKLSGVSGSGAAAEKSLISILAAGTKEGLDKSEFANENRKFTQQIAEIVYRTGAQNPNDAASIANREAAFLANKTTRGLEAAQQASQFVSGIEKQGSGIGATLEMGAMLGNKNLSKLGPVAMAAVQNMDMNQIMSLSDAEKKSLARRSGFNTFDEFIQAVAPAKDIKLAGQMPQLFEATQRARDLNNKIPMGPLTAQQQAQKEDAEADVKLSLKAGFGMDNATADSMYKWMTDTGKFDMSSIQKQYETVKGKMDAGAGATGRTADVVTAAAADNENVVNTLQKTFIPSIDDAAKSVGKFSEEIEKSLSRIQAAGAQGKQDEVVQELKRLNTAISSRFGTDNAGKDASGNPMVQTQGAPPKGGQ